MQTATSQPHPSVVAWGFMDFAQRKWVSGWARATSALFQEYPITRAQHAQCFTLAGWLSI